MKIASGMLLVVAALLLLAPPAQAWETITSEGGEFSVEMPGEAFAISNEMPTTTNDIAVTFFIAPSDEIAGVVYFAGVAEYPESDDFDAKVELDAAVAHFAESGNAEIISENVLEVEGGVGKEIRASGGEGLNAHMRALLIDHRIYFLAMSVPEGESDEEGATRFFESFQMLTPEAAP